jgi:hypothetical protein
MKYFIKCEGTLPLCCSIALEKAALWVDACASGASFWSAPNDTLLLSSLLEELAVILCSRCAIDFPLCIYTITEKNKQFWIFFIKIRQYLSYIGNHPKCLLLQIDNIYATNQLILFYFYQQFWIIQFHRKWEFSTW